MLKLFKYSAGCETFFPIFAFISMYSITFEPKNNTTHSFMKKIIITSLLALAALAGLAQTSKTATIKGYSPALKDGTIAVSLVDMVRVASDTIKDGHFTLTFPIDKLTECCFYLRGDGCPNFFKNIYLRPGVTAELKGDDCLYPLWKVDSPVPEQQTHNKIVEHTSDALKEYFQLDETATSWDEMIPVVIKLNKQMMDILPSLPVDAASLSELEDIAKLARFTKDFPRTQPSYMQQLKELEASISARAPKGFEEELALIHSYVYPPLVAQVGEEAIDAELYDMQGNKHHLSETFADGRYVLLDFWSLGCGPCRMAEPEMREVYEQMKGKLEIVGINRDKLSAWQESEWSKKIVWKNWNDGKMGRGGVESLYCDNSAIPYYVLLSPDRRVIRKFAGYGPTIFFGLAAAINGPLQDNGKNLPLAISNVEANDKSTTVSFRYYSSKDQWFRIAKESYLQADGKKYKITAVEGITLDEKLNPTEKASAATEGPLSDLYYTDFKLVFEPFETIPATFDFKEGEGKEDFVIRNVSLK